MKMSARIGLFIVAALLISTPVEASSSVEKLVEDATVNIYCSFRSGSKLVSSTGSGVIIDERGVILTNAHVAQALLALKEKKVKGSCVLRSGSPALGEYPVSLLYLSPTWLSDNLAELKKKHPRGSGEGDFALVYVTPPRLGMMARPYPTLPIATSPVYEDEETIAAGYPAETLDFEEVENELVQEVATPTITSVRSFTRRQPDVFLLEASTIGSAGVSGGPVADSNGNLLGIMTAVESSKKKERVTRGITISHIARELSSASTSLSHILQSDFASYSLSTYASFTSDQIKSVAKALLRIR